MIKKIYICDRCGSECEKTFSFVIPTKTKKTNEEHCEEMDLCPSCKYEFDNFLNFNKNNSKKHSTYDFLRDSSYMPFDSTTLTVDSSEEMLDRTNRIILNSGMFCKVFYPERGDE